MLPSCAIRSTYRTCRPVMVSLPCRSRNRMACHRLEEPCGSSSNCGCLSAHEYHPEWSLPTQVTQCEGIVGNNTAAKQGREFGRLLCKDGALAHHIMNGAIVSLLVQREVAELQPQARAAQSWRRLCSSQGRCVEFELLCHSHYVRTPTERAVGTLRALT